MWNRYALRADWRRLAPLVATAALLASSMVSAPASAQIIQLPRPATFTVNVNDDVDNGSCADTHCSLREAINAANYVPICFVFEQPCRNTVNFRLALVVPLNVIVSTPLPQITGSVDIEGANLPTITTLVLPDGRRIPFEVPHPGNVQISGNLSSNGDGLVLAHGPSAVGTIVNNLRVSGFTGSGIHIKVGANGISNSDLSSNNGNGILMDAGNNSVRNSTITNNHGAGIGATGTVGSGTAIFGDTITGNSGDGVTGAGFTIGSTSTTDRNVISGNGGCGIRVPPTFGQPQSTILGNYIGVDATGATALANTQGGVCAFGGGITVGGGAPGAGNVISGNGSASDTSPLRGHGITVDASVGAANSLVQGNVIGTNAAGTAAIPNAKNGINVTGNSLGGVSDSQVPSVTIVSNVISGNGNNGIAVFDGFKHVIQSNFIGTDAAGTASIPNQFNGIFIDDARSVTVGMPISGGDPSQGNVIAHNFEAGVSIFTESQNSVRSAGNTLRGNSISSNTRLGMDLVPVASQIGFGVVTQPSSIHPDSGPNHLQNLPQLTAAVRTTSTSGEAVVVVGNMFSNLAAGNLLVDVYANSSCDLSGFGQGQQWLGVAVAGPSPVSVGGQLTGFSSFGVSIPTATRLADGTAITATVTSSARGDTSEFSKCLVVDNGTGAPQLAPANASVAPEQELTYTFKWILPAPRPWRSLSDLELRLRDPDSGDVPLLVRWDETPNTFRLFNASAGKFGPAGSPGDDSKLANHGVQVVLAHAAVVGSGPTGQSVTLTIPLILNPQFAGRTYIVDVAAGEDNGQRSDFSPAGILQVSAK